jgi:hypothetical protein
MRRKFTPNDYRIEGDVAYIALIDRGRGRTVEAVINRAHLERVLAAGHWTPNWNTSARAYYPILREKEMLLHRFVVGAPPGTITDHKNHDTLDCRDDNLRICSHAQNMQNRRGAHRHSKSGVRNTYWDASRQSYLVKVRANGHRRTIGRYKTIEEAEAAAIAARQSLHGEFAS